MADERRYRVVFARRAVKDIDQLSPKLRAKLQDIVNNRLAVDPQSGKKLVGDLAGYRSVRLTYKDRIVYRIDEEARTVYVVRARTHYDMP
jgi:mRNA-degrading endonuclease RelE of RelBE toxin-antitoxin system